MKGLIALNIIKTGNPLDFSWLNGGASGGAAVIVFLALLLAILLFAISRASKKK